MAAGNDILAGMAFEMADKINVDAARKAMESEAAAAAAAAAATCAAATSKTGDEGWNFVVLHVRNRLFFHVDDIQNRISSFSRYAKFYPREFNFPWMTIEV